MLPIASPSPRHHIALAPPSHHPCIAVALCHHVTVAHCPRAVCRLCCVSHHTRAAVALPISHTACRVACHAVCCMVSCAPVVCRPPFPHAMCGCCASPT